MNVLTPAAVAPVEAPTAPMSFSSEQSACILVIDDQPSNIQMVGSVLGHLGYEILPACDGVTAMKRLSLRKPDLILLDLLMPGKDGCEVCRQIKENKSWKDIPIIFLSAADDKDLTVRALNAGGVDYITKPFNHSELVTRVRTQLELKNTRDRLQQLAEDKDELLGILAHDLKNFLGGINMSADLIHKQAAQNGNERLRQLAENIVRTSAQSLAFVKEFLANAAADHGYVPRISAVNISEIAANVVRQYAEFAGRKNLTIETNFPAKDSTVIADASALHQVLENLVSNALKFSPQGKCVYVSILPGERDTECVIRDEGPGFTAQDKARMFRRYGRLSARPTGGEPSTGLGLSIVRKLMRVMNGELSCDSKPGCGATFRIRLPRPLPA